MVTGKNIFLTMHFAAKKSIRHNADNTRIFTAVTIDDKSSFTYTCSKIISKIHCSFLDTKGEYLNVPGVNKYGVRINRAAKHSPATR